jgi:Ca2+-binding RTX toxin-like protein
VAGLFNVKDFGAKGDGVTDDTAAVQAALNAADAAGGGQVYAPAGIYAMSVQTNPRGQSQAAMFIRENTEFFGDGMGATVFRLIDGSNEDVDGFLRTPTSEVNNNIVMRDFTIDGNRANTQQEVIGFLVGIKPFNKGGNSDITVDSVEARDFSSYGFDPHEITYNFSLVNSIAHGNGKDGFVADYLVDSNFSNNIAWENDRHGFNITTSVPAMLLDNNISFTNGATGMVFQRGNFDIPVPTDNTVKGGAFYDNADEGLIMRLSNATTVIGIDSFDNQKGGVRFRGATNSTVENSVVRDNSQGLNNTYDDVYFSSYVEDVINPGAVIAAANNVAKFNLIYSSGLIKSRWGVREFGPSDPSNNNDSISNIILGQQSGSVMLYGIGSENTPFDPLNPGSANPGLYLVGAAGNDSFRGANGADTIIGDAGNDSAVTSGGNDIFAGMAGDDVASGGDGNDSLYGDGGADSLSGGNNDDRLFGDAGNDTLLGGSGNDSLFGGDGDDSITGNSGNDTIIGDRGNDTIRGNDGNDSVLGYDGNNVIYGDKNNDTLMGGKDSDTIFGGSENDHLMGFEGNDSLLGDGGNDTLAAGDGDDTVFGGSGNDVLAGGFGNDSLSGDSNNDYIDGSIGNDTLSGGTGNDILIGGVGNDIIRVGSDSNRDVVFFSNNTGVDSVAEFRVNQDIIRITDDVFANAASALAAVSYASGNALLNLGAGNLVTFLSLANNSLTVANFEIV